MPFVDMSPEGDQESIAIAEGIQQLEKLSRAAARVSQGFPFTSGRGNHMNLIRSRIHYSDEPRLHVNPGGVDPVGSLNLPEFRSKVRCLAEKGLPWIGDDLDASFLEATLAPTPKTTLDGGTHLPLVVRVHL